MNLSALTQIQAAALLSVAPRTLRDWHDVPRNPDGTYPGPALVAYYVAKLGAAGGEFDDQRQRLAAAQAEKVEHENAVRRGELADMRDVERFWTDCIANARAKALALPSKLSPRLVNIGDASLISAAIRAECHAFLAELVDYSPPAGGPAGLDVPRVEDVESAAEPDGKRVGRPRKKTQQRKQRRARPVAD
jgi:hypothetical protein